MVDSSVWGRVQHDAVTKRLDEEDDLYTCVAVALEVGMTARNQGDHAVVQQMLSDATEWVPMTPAVEARALQIQRALAGRGYHRAAKLGDCLIAATAEAVGARVLHYDHDFDLVMEVTGVPCEWVVPRGSL